jgi:hypothetical protein
MHESETPARARRLFFLLIVLCISGCSESDAPSTQPTATQERMKADIELMKDRNRAGPELERRLSAAVRAKDGAVIMDDPVVGKFFSQTISPNTSWVLHCGAGISIAFGGRSDEIQLFYGHVDASLCADLAPRLGKRLNVIFREAATAAAQ